MTNFCSTIFPKNQTCIEWNCFDPDPQRQDQCTHCTNQQATKVSSLFKADHHPFIFNYVSFSESDLAGVDTILSSIEDFILQSFALHGQDASSSALSGSALSRTPGLLLCGASGSGRTSVVKEVVKRLEWDRRVFACMLLSCIYLSCFDLTMQPFQIIADPLYIDLSKFTDERIATIKALFDKWLDIASWHKPSILVLDNLDRVVGPEVEVNHSMHYLNLDR